MAHGSSMRVQSNLGAISGARGGEVVEEEAELAPGHAAEAEELHDLAVKTHVLEGPAARRCGRGGLAVSSSVAECRCRRARP